MDKNKELFLRIKERSDQVGGFLANEVRSLVADQDFVNLTSKQLMLLDLIQTSPLTINEISATFQMTVSAASQLVKKLETKEYVRREINLENRREILVKLDQKGTDYIKKIAEVEYYLFEKYYGQLEDKELFQLKEILDKLYAITFLEHTQKIKE